MCNDFGQDEKYYDYIQILSNNSLFNHGYVKQCVKREYSQNTYLFDPRNVSIDKFLETIILRVQSLPILFSQLENFGNKKYSPQIAQKLKEEKRYQIVKEKTNIIEFKKITQADFYSSIDPNIFNQDYIISTTLEKNDDGSYYKRYIKLPSIPYTEDEALYYSIIFERKNIRVTAFLEISFDYPRTYYTINQVIHASSSNYKIQRKSLRYQIISNISLMLI
jgi:hypothetical protein